MIEPWAPEYRLQLLEVERIVSDNTDLDTREAVVLDEGWDFYCYLINKEFVFRFPKRQAEAERLINEKVLLENLNLTTATPNFDFFVDRPVGFHLPFAGYQMLSGSPLFEISKADVDSILIGNQLGHALRELHAQTLTPVRPPHDPVVGWLRSSQRELENISGVIDRPIFEACGALLTNYQPQKPSERDVTTHGDLHAGHVLVDKQGELTGLIDWTDAHTSNRYTDFAGLWSWGGDGPVVAALETYRRIPKSVDWGRLRALGVINIVGLIDFGVRSDDSKLVATGLGWLRDRQSEGELKELNAEPN